MSKIEIEKALLILKSDGKLEQSIKGFEPREEQQKMMDNILSAYNEDKIALIEAGTGTGKSFAYLIPAILWAAQNKERTLISTHTIALQEQLLQKDIPIIFKALNLDLKAVLIKGMGNYLCLRKFYEALELTLLLPDNEREELHKIDIWSQTTKDGSRSSLPFYPSQTTWERISAESDSCTNSRCPNYQECHFFKARKKANDAQILVVNHHLLFADLHRRSEMDNYEDPAILPAYQRIIIDEAHHIEDIATEYFAQNVNRLNLLRIIGRLAAEKQVQAHGKLTILKQKLVQYYSSKPLSQELHGMIGRLNIDLQAEKNELLTQIVNSFQAFSEFVMHLFPPVESQEKENKLRILPMHQTHPFWLQEIKPKVETFIQAIHRYTKSLEGIEQEIKMMDDEKLKDLLKADLFEITSLSNRLKETGLTLSNFISDKIFLNKVKWIEIQSPHLDSNIHLNEADLDISRAVANFLFSKFPTIVLCSATLTTNKKFGFIRERLGLTEKLLPKKIVTENFYQSPFNFKKQALLVVPTDMVDPSDGKFLKEAAERIFQSIKASHGNAFVLFTSYSMLNSIYQILEKKLRDLNFSLLKQGDESRQKLLEKFKKKDRSILFGTDSFWEGVDVSGEALRLVIIVKLPFKVPSEPIVQARSEAILSKGGDPFIDYSLPSAIVKFKQGFGRLIRNKSDRGCIVCLDNRLLKKGYGKQFLNSLPDCEKFFGEAQAIEKEMKDFYKRTYHLVKK